MLAAASSKSDFVDLSVPIGAWIALAAVIALMLAVDLYRHREAHEPSPKEALGETLVWVACGLVFAGVIAVSFGGAAFGEYISGYLIEKSLSIDNVFVWAMLFGSLSIPLKYQHRVLFWGIITALLLRLVMIWGGVILLQKFHFLLYIFGGILILTGIKILYLGDRETDLRGKNFCGA